MLNVVDDIFAKKLLDIYDKCGGNRSKLQTFRTVEALIANLEQAPKYKRHYRDEIENITNDIFLEVEDVSIFMPLC